MTVMEILNLIAIIIIPIFAVIVGQFLQNKVSIRNEKVRIFKRLMTYRNIGYTDMASVEYLNQIPILFINNKKVMAAYNDFIELMNIKVKDAETNLKLEKAKKKLLETMARALHYNKINWEVIETPYLPPETMENKLKGEQFSNNMFDFYSNLNQFLTGENTSKLKESIDLAIQAQKEDLKRSARKKTSSKKQK